MKMTPEISRRMHAAKARRRMAAAAPDYPALLPLNVPVKRILVEDFRAGTRHELVLFPSARRRNQFRVEVDGLPWKESIGYSRIMSGLRKAR